MKPRSLPPPKAERIPQGHFLSPRPKAALGSSPPWAKEASLGKELLKKTLQMQKISEEKGREVKTRGVCVCAYACVTLGQTYKPATCLQPAARVSSKLHVYTPSRGAKRKISDEEINMKNILSKAL